MIASGHNAIGTTVGLVVITQVSEPMTAVGLAIIFGLVFHYLADAVPHGHFLSHAEYRKLPPSLYLDLFGSFVLLFGIVLFKFGLTLPSLVILGAIGASQLPDVIEGLLEFRKLPRRGIIKFENDAHQKIFHWHGRHANALPWGWTDIWQITVVILALFFLLYY
jgi:hypothetical protein